ncbi:8137_t:CDS:10 [Entrophospora sp. SA101]|nr:11435_t:CDS:10 [Entrophospora sp. SA101]CAJ0834834.1 8137_t:CDS:10 [Entrophospora sp. SA101]
MSNEIKVSSTATGLTSSSETTKSSISSIVNNNNSSSSFNATTVTANIDQPDDSNNEKQARRKQNHQQQLKNKDDDVSESISEHSKSNNVINIFNSSTHVGELQSFSSSFNSNNRPNKISKDDSENKSEALESLQQMIASSIGRKPNINKHKKGASVSFFFPSANASTSINSIQDPDDGSNKPMNIENALQDTLTSLRRMSQDRGKAQKERSSLSSTDQDPTSPKSPFDFKRLNDEHNHQQQQQSSAKNLHRRHQSLGFNLFTTTLANANTNPPPIFPVKSLVESHGRRHSVALNNNKDILKELEKNQTRTIGADGKGHPQPFNQFQTLNKFGGGLNQKKQQSQQNSNQQQRKSLFAPYLPQASLPSHIKAGELVYGVLRINKRNRSDAYVTTETLDTDIYICGSKDRNRALEGDIVAVQLLDPEKVWQTKKEKEEKKRKKEESAGIDKKKVDKKKDDVEVEGQGLLLFEDDEIITDDQRPKYCGHVVAVMERMPGQMFSGTLALLRPSSSATKEREAAERARREAEDRANGIEPKFEEPKDDKRDERIERPKIVWFKPTDKRVPLIAIPTEQAPTDFVERHQSYAQQLFVACIKRWPITSLHPFGTLVTQIGEIGNIDVETQALIRDNNISTEEFNENVLKCLPQTPWTIPEEEIEMRRDLRSIRIFTIDPSGAKDLDDAISCTRLPDGNYEIGVHIADASYFVKPNSVLDREARKRATSVYLVQKYIPMLPNLLSEDLCSLVSGVDRSCAKLSYDDVQEIIDGKPLNPNVNIHNGYSASEIEADIRAFHDLSQKMRELRHKRGALSLNSVKLTFDIDENENPIECHVYKYKEANCIVKEFMLLANISVAQKISSSFPEQALLRRHAAPIERRLNDFLEHATRFGYKIDISSASALQRSFNTVDNEDARKVLELLAIKPLQRAKYFCTGTLDIIKYQHYALNVPLYTHFTSPIRRYADVLVHRMLEAALSGERKFYIDKDNVQKTASYCNVKKEAAKNAQEQSSHLFLSVLLNNLTVQSGPVIREAIVVGVKEHAFDVLVPYFGIEKRVHLDQLPLEKFIFNSEKMELTLVWKQGISSLEAISDDYVFVAEEEEEGLEVDEEALLADDNDDYHYEMMDVTSLPIEDEHRLFDNNSGEDDDGYDEETQKTDAVTIEHTNITTNNITVSSPGEKVSLSTPTSTSANKTSCPVTTSSATVIKQPEVSKLSIVSDPTIPNSQIIRELTHLNVIITADCKKSPPVIKVLAVNPFA